MHPLNTFSQWIHHFHFGPDHPGLTRCEHALHDKRLWWALLGATIFALFVWLMVWTAGSGAAPYQRPMSIPIGPYGY
jgi:hypothetical protein